MDEFDVVLFPTTSWMNSEMVATPTKVAIPDASSQHPLPVPDPRMHGRCAAVGSASGYRPRYEPAKTGETASPSSPKRGTSIGRTPSITASRAASAVERAPRPLAFFDVETLLAPV